MEDRMIWRCMGCDRRWASIAEAHCSGCHQQFGSASTFDNHRFHGRCLNPARQGMKLVERRTGPVWVTDKATEAVPILDDSPTHNCEGCGFEFPRRRGRYPRFCDTCKEALVAA